VMERVTILPLDGEVSLRRLGSAMCICTRS
jgi:hypothetical protein